jgi:cell division protein FtsI (penicillin-binding protein 3)
MKARIKPMTPGIPHAARLRAYLAALVVTAGLSGVAWRAWALQIGDGERYRALAARQHESTVEIPAPRGDIVDVRGRPLAVSADTDSIWANPREIRDVTNTADKLAALIGGNAAALEAKLGGDRRFVWLARHVTPALAREIREARLSGIEVGREPRRWYPERAIGGLVIGRSDIDGKGVDGIELAMNAQLIGQRGEGLALRDVRGKRMFADGLERPQPGATVQLSLDSTIQAIADAAIADAVRTSKAKSGVVVAIDIATGRVAAMASAPSYDPNAPGAGAAAPEGARSEPARNRPVTDAYEAGSVMKIFSVAAALDDGTVAPDTEFDLNGGQLVVGKSKAITDIHHDPYLTVAGIIKRSSNVGAAKIALRFGSTKLYAALRRFGFGTRTGIELPGETPGMLRDGARWRDRDLASIAFGYGLAVTPLQIAAAVAVFGNHGRYRAPRIVERVIDGDGTVLYQADEPERQVVSERTASQMATMLASVFEGGKFNGTAWAIVVPGFRCAGKTGTAHKYDPETHNYSDRHLASFAGLAPADHPRLAIVVLVDEPSEGDYFGASVAGPVFARVASEALRYLGVPGDPAVCAPGPAAQSPVAAMNVPPKTCVPAPRAARAAPSSPGAGATSAASQGMTSERSASTPAGGPASNANDSATSRTSGQVPGSAAIAADASASRASGQAPIDGARSDIEASAGAEVAQDALPLDPAAAAWVTDWFGLPAELQATPASDAGALIPDFRGMGMAHALATARRAHLAVSLSGTGRVVEQRPPPGPSRAALHVWLRFDDGSAAAVTMRPQ